METACSFCNEVYDNDLEECPFCGNSNDGMIRTAKPIPTTIEELKNWYEARAIKPFETIKPFFWENNDDDLARGIYKDPETGEFIVYNNHASDEYRGTFYRSTPYKGYDEAKAVEIFYKEIRFLLGEQKRMELYTKGKIVGEKEIKKSKRGCLTAIIVGVLLPVLFYLFSQILVKAGDFPSEGYYSYENQIYYAVDAPTQNAKSVNTMYWFVFDPNTDDWSGILEESEVPDPLEKNKTAKEFYLSPDWSDAYPVTDCTDSAVYQSAIQ